MMTKFIKFIKDKFKKKDDRPAGPNPAVGLTSGVALTTLHAPNHDAVLTIQDNYNQHQVDAARYALQELQQVLNGHQHNNQQMYMQQQAATQWQQNHTVVYPDGVQQTIPQGRSVSFNGLTQQFEFTDNTGYGIGGIASGLGAGLAGAGQQQQQAAQQQQFFGIDQQAYYAWQGQQQAAPARLDIDTIQRAMGTASNQWGIRHITIDEARLWYEPPKRKIVNYPKVAL